MICRHCGETMKVAARCCPHCGAKVEREDPREDDLVAVRRQGSRMWIRLAKGVEMEFIQVPAGEFVMGGYGKNDEYPPHPVLLDEYWMGRYPVTNAQYREYVNSGGREPLLGAFHRTKMENHPVINVDWEDARQFCEWLSGVSGQEIRLPTEAEWEKAARGTKGWSYPGGFLEPLASLCNFDRQVGYTTRVGMYSPGGDSPFGCADMAGNVWEWVSDWYAADYYQVSPRVNPIGPLTGDSRVLRGGSWDSVDIDVRLSNRGASNPNSRVSYSGFRCALSTSR